MTTNLTLYFLHWVFVVLALLVSWRRSKSLLHPHFIFTVVIVVAISDFLVRGYDDPNLLYIDQSAVHLYQTILLAILFAILLVTLFIRAPRVEKILYQHRYFKVSSQATRTILRVAILLLAAEIVKRLIAVNWVPEEVILQSLMPRGESAWDRAAYSGNFVFALITIMLPLAGAGFAYLSVNSRAWWRLGAVLGFSVTFGILLTKGSRTPVAFSLGALGLFWMLRQGAIKWRVVKLFLVSGVMVVTLSAMYLYRSVGYLRMIEREPHRQFELIYHQDDSYYRAIYAYSYADRTGESWDLGFFLFTLAVNPIPRAFWPGKPLITSDFFGGFKRDYVTNLFLGELVAISGVEGSIPLGIVVGVALYTMLFKSVKLLRYPMGIVAYLTMALYTYMCVRSLMNLTMFIYFPAFAVILVKRMGKPKKKETTPNRRVRPPSSRGS